MLVAIVIGLILLGIFFIIVEIFLIPGISIAGIAGGACLIGGVALSYSKFGFQMGTITLIAASIALIGLLYTFYKSKALDKMALKTDSESKTEPFRGLSIKPGDQGITVSRLAPIGKIALHDTIIEGRSENEMIDENTPVEVVEVGTYNVIVKKIN
jgi:membrane-bound ClpP family serine protease